MTDTTGEIASAPAKRTWLLFALLTAMLWGVWGALAGLSAQRGFPDTLVYCVWSITMIPPALVVLAREGFTLDRNAAAIGYGLAIGLLGAGGQLLLFRALTTGPAYLVFPIISLSPVITIALSFLLLRERTNWLGAVGIVLALVALPLFDFNPQALQTEPRGEWFGLALLILAAWGLQAFFIKRANAAMSAESIFFYMMISGLALAPVAWFMTDFSAPINWGWDGPWMTAAIQSLNAIGALMLVYAFRHGQAIVVSPLVNAAPPLLTALLSMALLAAVPGPFKIAGVVLAALASLLLAVAPERAAPSPKQYR